MLIAAIVGGGAVLTYLFSTFLFAFSGGQSRMVPIVNYTAIAWAATGVLVAGVVWRWRSAAQAAKWAAIVMAGGWLTALLVDWALSFEFGAG